MAKLDENPIMATNDDASECKRAAVQLGYWKDDYISYFVKATQRKAPEINRGYYARIKAIETFVYKFLRRTGDTAQIVNLGAGFDTLYWRLRDDACSFANYIEIDFAAVTSRKCHMIKKSKFLLDRIHDQDGEVKLSQTDLHAGRYHCMGADLRNLQQLEVKLQEAELDFSKPTLFIAECVLVYVEKECVNRLLAWLASKFKSALFVNYEMCNINDTFGDVMLGNLRARGCSLAGIAACKSLETQKNRFLSNNWSGAKAWDMVQVYHALPSLERQRIEKLEFLDEQELLIQLFQHYCICLGWLGPEFAEVDFSDN